MPEYFAGKAFVTPGSASQVTINPVYANQPPTALTVALLAPATGGPARSFVPVYSYNQLRELYRSGPIVDLGRYLYAPAQGVNGAYKVVVYRLNAATKAIGTIADGGAATVISLESRDAGLHTNQVRYRVQAGTTSGYKVSVQGYDGTATISKDNIARALLSIDYSGAGSAASLTITASQLTIAVTGGAAVESVTLPFVSYPTIQAIANALVATGGYIVGVLGNPQAAASTLDAVAAQSVLAVYTVNANTQAVVDWLNTEEPYIVATRVTGNALAPMAAYAGITGGTDGAALTTTDYQTALTALQAEQCNLVVVASEDSTVHTMVAEHCAAMSATGGNKERIGIVGGAAAETVTAAIARARALNASRAALCYPGLLDTNDAGVSVTRSPAYTAAAVAGIMAGLPIGQPGTRKPIRCLGVERAVTPAERDSLLSGGVLAIEADSAEGARIVQSLVSYAPDSSVPVSPISRELSSAIAADVLIERIRSRLDSTLIGSAGGPLLREQARSIAETVLTEATREGLIVGDEKNPAWHDLSAIVQGGSIRVAFSASVVAPVNYVFLTAQLSTFSN